MHVAKGLPPHISTLDAMTYWLESATAVGVRLEWDGTLTVLAPFGADDLVGLLCRPTPYGWEHRDEYDERIARKRWRQLWPRVTFRD